MLYYFYTIIIVIKTVKSLIKRSHLDINKQKAMELEIFIIFVGD